MIPTPDLSHLTAADYKHVYEPAEDTYILLDALEEDATELQSVKPRVCLEIGSGSGCVSSFVGSILGPSCLLLTTDINPHAASCTHRTGKQNKIDIDSVVADLSKPLSQRLRRSVDLLLFNPPYVPTDDDEAYGAQSGAGIEGSWAGGRDGMRITDILLGQLNELLSPKGRFYLVAVKQNDIPSIQRRMSENYGIRSEVVLQRRAGREHLFVVRFMR